MCGAHGARILFEATPPFCLAQCSNCGLVMTHPRLTDAGLLPHYPPSYYGKGNQRFHPALESFISYLRWRRVRRIEALGRKGRVLDVGCGRGRVLDFMRERGWEVLGLEVSENAAVHAREQLKLPLVIGDFLAIDFPKERFDAVIFWHSFEHVTNPAATLRKCKDILRPGGLLVLALPNYESLQFRWAGRNCFHLDIPRHVAHFPLSTLVKSLTEMGFQVKHVNHFCFEQNWYAWVQSILNMAGFRFNLLYDIIKTPSARTVESPFRLHPIQAILMLASLAIVAPLASALFLWEWVTGNAVSVEIYATKSG